MRLHNRSVMKELLLQVFLVALAHCQDERRYLDRTYVQRLPPDGGPAPTAPRIEDLYLDKYLETQDPKYFDPLRYPTQPIDPLLPQRDRDGTPVDVRTDYIPQGRVTFLLEQANDELSRFCNNDVTAHWEFETNINEATQIRAVSSHCTLSALAPFKDYFRERLLHYTIISNI
ncbi:unnamed protein product [Nezara viridula]|uniref:Neuropeptide n=1 Tax=Nezara viridula TaxID=85310 RepID=A0A9P0HCI6_NEZVI|nr:unnamed protein product [Nezara viridula]